MNDERRLMLAVALSLAIYLGWSFFLMKTRKLPPTSAPATTSQTEAPSVKPAPTIAPTAVAPTGPESPRREEQLVELESPELRLVFSSRGATLVHATLKKAQYRRHVAGRDEPVDLVRGEGGVGHALGARFDGSSWLDEPLGDYDVARDGATALLFSRRVGGTTLTRRYEVVAPYQLAMTVGVSGGTARALSLSYGGVQPPGGGAPGGGIFGRIARSYPNVATAICRVDGKSDQSAPNKDAQATLPVPPKLGAVEFGGLDERFFVAAVTPQGDRLGSCTIQSTAAGSVESTIELPLAAGAPIAKTFGIFLGPKDLDLLQKASLLPGRHDDGELASTVGFGFWTALCVPMLRVMEIFHRAIPNWGIAILLLTLVIRLLLFPLQQAQ
ncbi:MAG: membrane protein insertase YidC, partial [Deltaproteobacteria bacterium]